MTIDHNVTDLHSSPAQPDYDAMCRGLVNAAFVDLMQYEKPAVNYVAMSAKLAEIVSTHRQVADVSMKLGEQLERQVEQLMVERDQARKAILAFGKGDFDWGVLGRIDDLEVSNAALTAERDRLKAARKLKGLVWDHDLDSIAWSESEVGTYLCRRPIGNQKGRWTLSRKQGVAMGYCDSIEHGKQLCFQNYCQRVESLFE